VDVRVAPQAARHIRGARLLILPGVGHVAQMEAPVIVARAIVGMLDEIHSDKANLEHVTALGA
jgi:pimeloyl-ACP methyl ester carboxylesterase